MTKRTGEGVSRGLIHYEHGLGALYLSGSKGMTRHTLYARVKPVEAHIVRYVRIRVVTRNFASLLMQRGFFIALTPLKY
jgi:hypothetical protein